MSTPELPAKASRRELRITLLRMRLEMHRQELRHETLVMLQPLHQAKQLGQQWREALRSSTAPLWMAGGAVLLATLGMRSSHWRRGLRLALLLVPLLRRQQPATGNAPDTAEQADRRQR